MKTYRTIIVSTTVGLAAVAAAVAGVRSPAVGVEGVFGFAAVGALLAFAAIDYKLNRNVFSK